MKIINFFLIITLLISTITPSTIAIISTQKLVQLKKEFTSNAHEFIKCIKGDVNCDPKKKKVYRTFLALTAAIGLAITAGGVAWYLHHRHKPEFIYQYQVMTPEEKTQTEELARTHIKEAMLNGEGKDDLDQEVIKDLPRLEEIIKNLKIQVNAYPNPTTKELYNVLNIETPPALGYIDQLTREEIVDSIYKADTLKKIGWINWDQVRTGSRGYPRKLWENPWLRTE